MRNIFKNGKQKSRLQQMQLERVVFFFAVVVAAASLYSCHKMTQIPADLGDSKKDGDIITIKNTSKYIK